MNQPTALGRLFPGMSSGDIECPEAIGFVIGRVLEEGDREDLHWLSEQVEEPRLRKWLAERGSRQLSRRSRAFWSLLLSTSDSGLPENPLWPL